VYLRRGVENACLTSREISHDFGRSPVISAAFAQWARGRSACLLVSEFDRYDRVIDINSALSAGNLESEELAS